MIYVAECGVVRPYKRDDTGALADDFFATRADPDLVLTAVVNDGDALQWPGQGVVFTYTWPRLRESRPSVHTKIGSISGC